MMQRKYLIASVGALALVAGGAAWTITRSRADQGDPLAVTKAAAQPVLPLPIAQVVLFNSGEALTVKDCQLSNCVGGSEGGGIYAEAGTLTLYGDTISSNQAVGMAGTAAQAAGSAQGGGIYSSAPGLSITATHFASNSALGGNGGGAGGVAAAGTTYRSESPQ